MIEYTKGEAELLIDIMSMQGYVNQLEARINADRPVTDAELEAAVSAFFAYGGEDPGALRGAMRAALEAARKAV